MLLRFGVANHRSILAPIELSMIAVDHDRAAARSVGNLAERVLTVAGVYGANASGKSNVLDALAWLSKAVGGSVRVWDEEIPREPFTTNSGPANPSTFEVDMVVGDIRYTYHVELTETAVESEALYSYPERRPRTLFRREGQEVHFRRGLGGVAGTRELLTPTTLALSAAMRFPESGAREFGRALAGIVTHGLRSTALWRFHVPPIQDEWQTIDLFRDGAPIAGQDFPESDLADAKKAALRLLRYAELGIDDVKITEERTEVPRPGEEPFLTILQRAHFIHQVGGRRVLFQDGQESRGTTTWFSLIGPLLHALRYGKIMLFDEIDASLHPRLSARVIEMFQDPKTNAHGAQLVFTSHDTSLLNHLNRDEVWLTEKGGNSATNLTALAEYGGDKVRRSLNIEKAYLQGRFGAVPEFDQSLLLRALDLEAGHR